MFEYIHPFPKGWMYRYSDIRSEWGILSGCKDVGWRMYQQQQQLEHTVDLKQCQELSRGEQIHASSHVLFTHSRPTLSRLFVLPTVTKSFRHLCRSKRLFPFVFQLNSQYSTMRLEVMWGSLFQSYVQFYCNVSDFYQVDKQFFLLNMLLSSL